VTRINAASDFFLTLRDKSGALTRGHWPDDPPQDQHRNCRDLFAIAVLLASMVVVLIVLGRTLAPL
jgi:hypothetical protein